MIIYFVRHGETEWNKKKIIQGHKDSPLTLKGKVIAKKLGKILSSKKIEIIYVSDLGRCVQTAKIINKCLKIRLIKTPRLRERNFGYLNGRLDKEVKKVIDLSNPDEIAPNGESFHQLKNRIINFIESLSQKKLKSVLLVTHEGPVRAILSNYYGVSFKSKKCDSRAVLIYKVELINNKMKKKRTLK